MRDFLLFLHILGAGTWLGANVAQIVSSSTMGGSGGLIAAAWYRTSLTLGRYVYGPAGILIIATGIFLVTTSDGAFEFSDLFVTIGFVVVIIGIVLGITVFGRQGMAAADAAERGDTSVLQRARGRLAGFGVLDTLLVAFTIYAMVAKLGS
ncbi:MAG: hypothetical protein EHM57_03485 [Actinobacteria bacterium]|nr:MAG: hypothetical protein EHM57_03485 [Actinomycetota bacterium]